MVWGVVQRVVTWPLVEAISVMVILRPVDKRQLQAATPVATRLEDRPGHASVLRTGTREQRDETGDEEARGGASSSAGPYPSETFNVSQKVKFEHVVSFDEGQPRAGLSEAEAKQKAKQRNGKWHEDANEEDEENKARKEARKDEAAAEIQG